MKRSRALVLLLPAVLFGASVLALSGTSAHADDPTAAAKAARNARCATRLSITLLGKSPDAAMLASDAPESRVDAMLVSPEFRDRFSSFVNSSFNGGPSTDPTNDPVYFLTRYVLEQNKPWKDLFVGPYDVRASTDRKSLDVVASPTGLGYFRTAPWMLRYAGNEEKGIRLSAAYHMINNTTAFEVPASVAKPGEDRTAAGRKAAACEGCHFTPWFALDKAAAVLSQKRVAADGTVTFDATTVTPTALLGKTLNDDKDLVTSLVDSEAFKFAQCRMVFKFLYGRPENQCEAPLFDKCVDELSKGSIVPAVAVIAKDASFCQ